MRIAIYAGMFKKNHDGAVKTLYELTDSLLEQGIEVGVWAFQITPQQRKGLSLYTIPSVPLPLYRDYRVSLPNPKLKQQIIAFAPDVIHIAAPDAAGIYLMQLARKRGIKVVMSYHTDFPSYLKSYRLSLLYHPCWWFFRWFYNRADVVSAPTETMIRRLLDHGIANVKLWSRGIHPHLYNPSYRSERLRRLWGAGNKKVILYSGRFVWYKDLETFVGVYELFKQRAPEDVLFVLAGDGPIRDELQRRMPDAVFTGYLHGEELSRVYASSDILLFPSTTEAFGNVVLEALASGVPAVVSDEGGCREIVEKSGAGLVVTARRADLFYESCKLLVEDPHMFQRFRAKGLNFAAARSWAKINGGVIDEYRRVQVTANGENKGFKRLLKGRFQHG